MKIDTDDVVQVGKYALAGSIASLVLALWVPAIMLLGIEAATAGAVYGYMRITGKKPSDCVCDEQEKAV